MGGGGCEQERECEWEGEGVNESERLGERIGCKEV